MSGFFRTSSTTEDAVGELIAQLGGIGGSRSVGFGKNKIGSIPDAVAKVLAEEFGYSQYKASEENGNTNNSDDEKSEYVKNNPYGISSNVDMCPECGNYSFIREEGCVKCHDCGYSVC